MASPVVIFICCLTKLYLDCLTTHHPKVTFGWDITDQLNWLYIYHCCWATEDSNWTVSKHCKVIAQYPQGPFNVLCQDTSCLEKLPLLADFFQNMSLYNNNMKVVGGKGLSISWLSYSNVGPCNASETRSACPTFTRVANIGRPGTSKKWGITAEARHGARVKLPL